MTNCFVVTQAKDRNTGSVANDIIHSYTVHLLLIETIQLLPCWKQIVQKCKNGLLFGGINYFLSLLKQYHSLFHHLIKMSRYCPVSTIWRSLWGLAIQPNFEELQQFQTRLGHTGSWAFYAMFPVQSTTTYYLASQSAKVSETLIGSSSCCNSEYTKKKSSYL